MLLMPKADRITIIIKTDVCQQFWKGRRPMTQNLSGTLETAAAAAAAAAVADHHHHNHHPIIDTLLLLLHTITPHQHSDLSQKIILPTKTIGSAFGGKNYCTKESCCCLPRKEKHPKNLLLLLLLQVLFYSNTHTHTHLFSFTLQLDWEKTMLSSSNSSER